MHVLRRLRRLLAQEHGSFLIEALATAAILLTVSAGVLLALQTAQVQSGQQRTKALATDLAQSTLDTLRTRAYNDLRTLNATTTASEGGVDFTVASTATPVAQTDAPSGCSNQRARDYVRLSTTVSWAKMGTRKPVTLTTLVAAPVGAGGGLIVTASGAAGQPVAGIPVTLDPNGGSATTDASGCARWDSVAAGTGYGLTASTAGYVQPNGEQDVDLAGVNVAAEQTATASFAYDRGGSVALRFQQVVSGTTPTDLPPDALPPSVTLTNSGATVVKDVVKTGGATATAGLFYPYPTTAYSAYADSCTAAQPTGPGLPAGAAPSMLVPAGGTARTGANQPFDLLLPSLNVRVAVQGSATPPADTRVRVKTACGTIITGRTVDSSGLLTNPGLPYGTGLRVCATTGNRAGETTSDNTSYAAPSTSTAQPLTVKNGARSCSF